MRSSKIYSVDFDGTIVAEGKFPGFGEKNNKVISYIREIQGHGDKWILNTCREYDKLNIAINYLSDIGLYPDAINDNIQEMKDLYHNNPRKIFADVYIDDKNAGGLYLPPINGTIDFGLAIRALKQRKKVMRSTWSDSCLIRVDCIYFKNQTKSSDLKMILKKPCSFIIMMIKNNTWQEKWIPSQEDILAEDWYIIN